VAQEFGWSAGELTQELDDEDLHRSARSQFDSSRTYGTNALPNVIVEEDGERRLLFGGYADSEMIVSLVRDAFATTSD
jgi:predicted DsbA family dithiol-disulfide isomerase